MAVSVVSWVSPSYKMDIIDTIKLCIGEGGKVTYTMGNGVVWEGTVIDRLDTKANAEFYKMSIIKTLEEQAIVLTEKINDTFIENRKIGVLARLGFGAGGLILTAEKQKITYTDFYLYAKQFIDQVLNPNQPALALCYLKPSIEHKTTSCSDEPLKCYI